MRRTQRRSKKEDNILEQVEAETAAVPERVHVGLQ